VGQTKKLLPKYIGPYTVIEAHNQAFTVKLELPAALEAKWIKSMFHASLVRLHIPNDNERFPHRDVLKHYDFGQEAKEEWYVDEMLAHHWNGSALEFQVRWSLGNTTWKPLASCKQLEALDAYLELRGVKFPRGLPRYI
jgi:hypothetical protein